MGDLKASAAAPIATETSLDAMAQRQLLRDLPLQHPEPLLQRRPFRPCLLEDCPLGGGHDLAGGPVGAPGVNALVPRGGDDTRPRYQVRELLLQSLATQPQPRRAHVWSERIGRQQPGYIGLTEPRPAGSVGPRRSSAPLAEAGMLSKLAERRRSEPWSKYSSARRPGMSRH